MVAGSSLVLLLLPSLAVAQQWSEGFETGLAGVRPYHREPPDAKLEIASDGAAEGKQFLRATLPGKRPLEGFNLTASGLAGGRLATVTAKVRGRGEIWLCLIAGNGWLYSARTTVLTDRWQEIALTKILMAKDKSLGIHFLSRTVQSGAVFEVDHVQVTLAAPPQVYDATVGPWRCEAEDHAARRKQIADDRSASDGKAVSDREFAVVLDLPFPRTSRPVHVFLRAKSGSPEANYRLITFQGGNREIVSHIKPEKIGEWQWLRFPPATAGEIGDSFGIELAREKGVGDASAMDSVVISTRSDLDAATLDKVPPLFPHRPLAVVTRTASPPVLDGKADDPCWRNTVACADFLLGGSLASAEAKTVARLCCDDRNLYALFVCDEPILGVAQQRRHEFAATVKERDGEVHRDDSCVVLLDPANTGRQVFDFAVNALGTIADARCTGPDLWETRDIQWNSQARAAGSMGDGTWTVEMAIPFADLAGKPPKVGEVWQVCLGRIAKVRKEKSSWNPSNRGFHDPFALGALVFAEPAVGVTLSAPSALKPGKNSATARLTPLKGKPSGIYLTTCIGAPAGNRHGYAFAAVADKPVEAAHTFEVRDEAEPQVAYGVLDAATLQPLYLTPRLTRAVKSSVATVTLACDGPYELFLNGEVVGRGATAGMVDIKTALQKGANVFALRLEKGAAAVRIAASGTEGRAMNWKINAADSKGATLPATDDSGWQTAPNAGSHPTLGAIVGVPGKPVVLRHTLLWEKTRSWPTAVPALYVARDSNQHITFIADGLPKRRLENWSLCLAVPQEFEVIGSTGYYGNTPKQPLFTCSQLGEQTVCGRKMCVAKIAADKPVVPHSHYIFSVVNAFVRYRATAAKIAETNCIYWTEANDGTVTEAPQTIPVRLLPPLRGRQPKTLVWQLWGSFFSNMDDLSMRTAILKTAQAAGINDIVSGDRWTSDNAPRFGIRHTMGVNFEPWALNLRPHLQQHPDERLINKDYKPNDTRLCMTLLLGDSWPAVEAALKKKLDAVRPHTVDYDYEYGPFDGPHSCYCRRCLAAFRERAGLPGDTTLDAQTIADKHAEAWIDFMAWRVAQMFLKFKETVHRLAPGTKVSSYSGYQVPENPRQYGVNWAYFGKLQACDRVGCGYGRPAPYLGETIQALAGIPAIFGALMTPYDTRETVPQSPLTKARLLRLSLDSTGGVLVYDLLPMDGRTWLAIAETTRLVSEFESLFLTGKRSALPGLNDAQVQMLSDGKLTLICAMNDGGNRVEHAIPLPAEAGVGWEFYSGRKVAAGETVNCSLPPGEAVAYVLRPK
jgi:hypothetical protein